MFKMKMIRIPSARVDGLCVGIFSSWQGWLCVGVLCALPCAKNCVGSGWQSHGCLYVCRIFNRVTYNVYGLLLCWYSVLRQPGPQPIEKLKLKIITYAQLYSLAGTKADSEPNDENIFVSQHSSKPPVEPTPPVKVQVLLNVIPFVFRIQQIALTIFKRINCNII
jgi:hypothetical protein